MAVRRRTRGCPFRVALLPLALAVGSAVLVGAPLASPAAAVPASPRGADRVEELRRDVVAWERRLLEAERASWAAARRVAELTAETTELAEEADKAAARTRSLHAQAAAEDSGALQTLVDLLRGRESAMDQAAESEESQREAEGEVLAAVGTLTTARAQAAEAEEARAAAVTEIARLETHRVAHVAARVAVAQAEFRPSYDVGSRGEDRRNRAALARWQRYLTGVAEAGLTPPPAATVEEDPAPEEPATSAARRGGARTVLPRETVRAVSAAFSRVGLPDAAGAAGADAYACGGLVSEAWARAGTLLPPESVEQWRSLRTVPLPDAQVGDAVYLGDDLRGIHRAGVYVGADQMIAVDPADGAVTVQPVDPDAVHGIKRPSLPQPGRRTAAPVAEGVVTGCGEVALPPAPEPVPVAVPAPVLVPPPATALGPDLLATVPTAPWAPPEQGSDAWVHPMGDGAYSMSAGFGREGSMWSSGRHTGQDFAAPVGTPVYAARAGVATVETPSWAGNLIRIDHLDGTESWYAHLSAVKVTSGQPVTAGQLVGAVGSEGNSTGPHLHFEIRDGGVPVDPMSLLP